MCQLAGTTTHFLNATPATPYNEIAQAQGSDVLRKRHIFVSELSGEHVSVSMCQRSDEWWMNGG